jgi:hypothetical protein
MISFTEFEKDGKVDWKAYHEAQTNAGERCCECGTYISCFGAKGPSRCGDCKMADTEAGEISHSSRVRCPFCKRMMEAHDLEIYGEGDHSVTCFDCQKDFTVNAEISFTFSSPALGKTGNEDDE